MRKATKYILSFAVILIAGLNFIVPAFAQDPFTSIAIGGLTGASGAGLFGSMAAGSGINIAFGQTSDPMDAMWNVLNPDHVYFSGEKHEATGTPEDLYDYIDVDIGDWLSAQSDFIVKFAQEYNVQDNDSGVITSVPTYMGYPFENVVVNGTSNGYRYGPTLWTVSRTNFSITYGDLTFRCAPVFANDLQCWINGRSYYNGSSIFGYSLVLIQQLNNPSAVTWGVVDTSTHTLKTSWDYNSGKSSTAGVNTSWTSGVVNTSVYDGWESARVKIPHSVSGLSPNWDVPDFLSAINNLWINNQQGQIVIEDTDQPVPPPPVPSTPLGDTPFDEWVDLWGQGIYEQLENQSDALDFIGSNGTDAIEELESIDENIGALEETAESIDTNIGIGNGILGGIRSLAQSAVDYLEGIAEHVGELVEEIVEGTETLIAGILNQIPQAFGVIFGPIKQASSIWHYVVEWIQSIGAPFQFIWSMANGTSYYIILPVYASLAAAVVLAFYKRFGK